MRTHFAHFASRLTLLLTGAFGVVVSQVWTGGTLQWLFFGGGILMILVALADAMLRPPAIQMAVNGLVVLLGAWAIVESLALDGGAQKWWSFGIACALAGLAAIGLVAHELTTERVVHQLDVKAEAGSRERQPMSTA